MMGPIDAEPTDFAHPVTSERLGPVTPRERIEFLDVLRGFAILGIVFVNYDVAGYYTSIVLPSALDRLGHALIYVFGSGKLWPLFAILFGVGFAIQLDRAESRGVNIIPVYLRRLFFLALIGCGLQLVINVQQLLLLVRAGVPMMFIGYVLRRQPAHWLLGVAIAALALNLSVSIPGDLTRDQGLSGTPEIPLEEVAVEVENLRESFAARAVEAGSWNLDRLERRVTGMLRWYVGGFPRSFLQIRVYANYIAYMILGIFLWRTGILKNFADHRRSYARLLAVTLPIGLAAAITANRVSEAWTLTNVGLGAYPSPLMRMLRQPLQSTASLALPLAYISTIALLMQQRRWSRYLRALVPAGRMALTNYALQALLPALLFGVYTPGLSQLVLGVWLTIFTLLLLIGSQVVLSQVWMRVYGFGPLEWLWRTLTYWRPQAMRLERAVEGL
jgi:uncharacterized protein